MSDFATIVAGEELLDMHINQFAGWLNGNDTDWYGVAAPKANDADNYTMTLQNVGAGGKALNVLNSSGASIFNVSNTGFALAFPIVNSDPDGLTGAILQRIQINAQDWGVEATAVDQTDAINDIFEVFRTMGDAIIVPGEGVDIYFPSGRYSVGSVNCTRCDNIQITGVPGGTFFFHDQMDAASPCWDFTGSSDIRVIGIGIAGAKYGSGDSPAPQSAVPTVAILQAPTQALPGSSNANYYEFIGGYGFFSVSFIYLFNTADTTIVWFHPNIDSSVGKPSIYITSSNGATVTSLYQTIYSSGGGVFTGNITFINVGGQGIHMDGASNINFFGGTVDGTTPGFCLRMTANNEKIGFYNVQWTANTDAPHTDPLGSAGGAITVANGTCRGLTIINPFMNNLVYSGSIAFIRAAADAIFTDPIIMGVTSTDIASGRKLINADNAAMSTTVTLSGGHIEAGGGDLTIGGSIVGTNFSNVGTLVVQGSWSDREPQFTAAKPLVVGDFAATSGWATSPSVSAVSGTTMAGSFTITSGGSGAGAANPVVTFTYPTSGGIFTAAPVIICQFIDSSDWTAAAAALTNIKCVTTTTTCTFTMQGLTPAATAKTYIFGFRVLTG